MGVWLLRQGPVGGKGCTATTAWCSGPLRLCQRCLPLVSCRLLGKEVAAAAWFQATDLGTWSWLAAGDGGTRKLHGKTRFEAAVKLIQSLPLVQMVHSSQQMKWCSSSIASISRQLKGPKLSPGFWDPVGRYKWMRGVLWVIWPKREAMIAYVEENEKDSWNYAHDWKKLKNCYMSLVHFTEIVEDKKGQKFWFNLRSCNVLFLPKCQNCYW